MTSKEAFEIIFYYFWTRRNKINKYEYEAITNSMNKLENDLEVLEQLEILKKYYSPFKKFLEEMFEKGYNKDLTKVKEWLEKVLEQ